MPLCSTPAASCRCCLLDQTASAACGRRLADTSGGAQGGPRSAAHLALDVDQGASDSQLRSAFRQAAMKWHPDKWASASRCTLGPCRRASEHRALTGLQCRAEQDGAAEEYDRARRAFQDLSS